MAHQHTCLDPQQQGQDGICLACRAYVLNHVGTAHQGTVQNHQSYDPQSRTEASQYAGRQRQLGRVRSNVRRI